MRVLDRPRPGRRVVAGRAAAGAARRFAVAAATAAAVLSTGLVGAVPAQAHGPVTPGTAAVIPPGTYSIRNLAYISQVLTSQNGRVVGSRERETTDQRWRVTTSGVIESVASPGKYLGSDGDQVALQDNPTEWGLVMEFQGRYKLEKRGDGRVTQLTGPADGAPVRLTDYTGARNQQWYLQHR